MWSCLGWDAVKTFGSCWKWKTETHLDTSKTWKRTKTRQTSSRPTWSCDPDNIIGIETRRYVVSERIELKMKMVLTTSFVTHLYISRSTRVLLLQLTFPHKLSYYGTWFFLEGLVSRNESSVASMRWRYWTWDPIIKIQRSNPNEECVLISQIPRTTARFTVTRTRIIRFITQFAMSIIIEL